MAGTYDGERLRLYLDGVEVASVAASGDLSPGNGVRISHHGTPGDDVESMQGLIDEARVYDRALSPEAIAALHAAPGTGLRCGAIP